MFFGMTSNRVFSLLLLYISSIISLHLKHRLPSRLLFRLPAYVSPERDPEYRDVIKKSLLQPIAGAEQFENLPVPKEGDVVQCPGLWPEEKILGKVRSLRYQTDIESWVAEVLPLKEGKTEKIFTVDKTSTSLAVKLSDLTPVTAFFVRAENGHKISYKGNTTELSIRAPRYRSIDQNYTLSRKIVNLEVVENDMQTYEELKKRIVVSLAQFGGVGTVVTGALYGPDVAVPYMMGVGAGALYLFLLGKKVDGVGAGFSVSQTAKSQTKLDTILSKARFLVPVALVASLAVKEVFIEHKPLVQFSSVPRPEFFGAISGFLTYRVSLFVSEVATEMRTEDWLGFLPGSFAEAYRQSKALKEQQAGRAAVKVKSTELTKIVFVTGPRAAGRSEVLRSLLGRDSKVSSCLVYCKYATSDAQLVTKYPDRYNFKTDDEINRLAAEGGLIFDSNEPSNFGPSLLGGSSRLVIPYPEAPAEVAPGKRKGPLSKPPKIAYVIEGEPAVLECLSRVPSLRLINVWISLQTKEQFIERASDIVKTELSLNSGGITATLAQESAQQVTDLVNQAARDITFYMQKAPLFELTLLNTGKDSETADELEQALEYSVMN